MSYTIKYDQDYKRTITAVIYDSRAVYPATKNIGGFDLELYVSIKISQASAPGTLSYKIITDHGVVAGYFTVATANRSLFARKIEQAIRPAFQQFITEIETNVNNFIKNGGFRPDLLL